jgi:hypothetical protein
VHGKIDEYIRTSSRKILKERVEKYIHNSVLVYVKDRLPTNFDFNLVLSKIEKRIPPVLVQEIDSLYVGQFDEVNRRNLQSIYKDGAIYITNEQTSEQEMIESIIHEIAHALEETYGLDIYADSTVEKEFMGKRYHMGEILKAEGYLVPDEQLNSPNYSQEFDIFLYKKIGYPTLTMLTMGLFVSPYAATSLREYFANGFEEYFSGNAEAVRKISPRLYEKIRELSYMGD